MLTFTEDSRELISKIAESIWAHFLIVIKMLNFSLQETLIMQIHDKLKVSEKKLC